ncbi:hypothetical protein SUVZ_05G2160 [Saccharomyces uvarum]|uniref:Uncharacterized protein n=1 Tax=Saccharomyces uvarum TaxID=230603 RepID=A0ABN8WSI1_SACUV|nr:hypothetical protein SUVZ_05G2160 [Saccharomyces uvarum]
MKVLTVIAALAALTGAALDYTPLADSNMTDLINCLGTEVAKYKILNESSMIVILPNVERILNFQGEDALLHACWLNIHMNSTAVLGSNEGFDYSSNSSLSSYDGPVGNGLRYQEPDNRGSIGTYYCTIDNRSTSTSHSKRSSIIYGIIDGKPSY